MTSFVSSVARRSAIAAACLTAAAAALPAFAASAVKLPAPDSRVALNPQPLPPRVSPSTGAVQQRGIIVQSPGTSSLAQRGIIVQSPKAQGTSSAMQQHGIIIVGGKTAH